MKLVILSAFSGRLISEPIEWPDEPFEIRLLMSRNYLFTNWLLGKDVDMKAMTTARLCVFANTGKHQVLKNGRTAAVYEMVEV